MNGRDVKEEIKSRIDIVSLIGRYLELKRGGSIFKACCPFHKEDTPSFTVFPNTQTYFCFGCQKHGDIFTFIMEKENVDFKTALEMLAKEAGVEIPKLYNSDSKDNKLKESLFKINEITARYFFQNLTKKEGKIGYDYLKKRGFTDNTIKQFGLGYAFENEKIEGAENIVKKSSDELLQMLKSQNFTDEEIDEAKIFNQYKSGLLFRGRVICPIVNKAGKIVGFSGRILPEFDDGQTGKYYNTSETRVFKKSRNLFGINYALKHCKESIILCEGNFDVISMHQAGFKNTVAPMGTAFNDDSAREIQNLRCKKIYLSYDADSAGKKSALKVIPYFESMNIPVYVIDLSPAKDPDELLKTLGPDEMKKRIEGAISSFDFELKMMASGFDLNHPDGRSGLYNSLIERLSRYRDRIKRKEYSDYAASVFHFDKADMLNGVEKYIYDKNLYKEDGEAKKDPVLVSKSPSSFAMDSSIVPMLMENQTIFLNALLDIKDAHDDIFNEAINYIKLGEIKTQGKTASDIFKFIQECVYRGMSQDDILSSAKEDPAFANDAQVLNNIAKIIYYDKYKSIKSNSSEEIRKYLSSLVRNIKKLQIEFEKQNLNDTENKLEIITKLNKDLQELKNTEFFGII